MPSIAKIRSQLSNSPVEGWGIGEVTHVQQEFVTVNGYEVVVVGDQGTTHGADEGPRTGGQGGPGDTVNTPGSGDGEDSPPSEPELHEEYQWRVSEGKPYITINGMEVAVVGSLCDCSHKITNGEDFVQIN